MDKLIWLLLALLIVFAYIFYKIYSYKVETRQKNKNRIIEQLNKYGKVSENISGDILKYEYQNETYGLYIWNVPSNCEITFNSKKIWEVRKGSSVTLKEMGHFTSKPGKKIVVITPKQEKLKRWENENEMKFIIPTQSFWNMYAIFSDDLDTILGNGFK